MGIGGSTPELVHAGGRVGGMAGEDWTNSGGPDVKFIVINVSFRRLWRTRRLARQHDRAVAVVVIDHLVRSPRGMSTMRSYR